MKRILLTAAIGLSLLAPGTGRAATTVPVFMSNLKFCATPVCVVNQNVTIAAGDTVAWIYADGMCTAFAALGCSHNVTRSSAPAFNSGQMPGPNGAGTNVVFQRTFTTRGTFSYLCTVHGAAVMSANVIVQ